MDGHRGAAAAGTPRHVAQTPAGRRAARDDLFRRGPSTNRGLCDGGRRSGAVPLPVVDVPLVLAAQAKLLHTLGDIYHQPMGVQRMAEIAGALGVGFLTRLGLRELLKLVPLPGLGPSVSAIYAAASTYALGMALAEYFTRVRGGAKLDVAVIRELYAAELKHGKQWIAQRLRGKE